jgi:malonate transporter and related proteins
MNESLSVLLPIFALIVTGSALRQTDFITPSHWAGFERVTYFVLFPAVLIDTLVRADLTAVAFWRMGLTLVATILVMALFLLLLRPWLEKQFRLDGPAFTSVFQGATRWNTFVALALASALFGREGTTLAAVSVAAMIPLLNILAVGVLARYATPQKLSLTGFLNTLIRNPFMWSCMIGIALNVSGLSLPKVVMTYTDMLGKASLSGGLLVVGAGLDLARLKSPHPGMILSCVLRLIGMPLLCFVIARTMDLTGATMGVVILSTAVPTASGAYILARQMGGDAELMAEILTYQTLLSTLTLPIVLFWLI